jgi:hypothetical protein
MVRARISTSGKKRTIQVRAKGRGLLGGVPLTTVLLTGKYTDVLLPVAQVMATGVQRGIIDWEWSLAEKGQALLPWGRTRVPVYFTLDVPKAPWSQIQSSGTLPWLDLLQYVVPIGAGEQAGNGRWVLGRLVRKFGLDLGVRYDLYGGGRPIYAFVRSSSFDDTFFLSAYIENVLRRNVFPAIVCDPHDGTWPTNLSAGCYDMAAILVLSGALLGLPLTYQFVEPYGYFHPLRLVGQPDITNDVGWYFGCLARPPLAGLDDVLLRQAFENHTYVTRPDGTRADACLRKALSVQQEAAFRQGAAAATAAGDRSLARDETDRADGLVIDMPAANYDAQFVDRSTPAENDPAVTGGVPQPQAINFL